MESLSNWNKRLFPLRFGLERVNCKHFSEIRERRPYTVLENKTGSELTRVRIPHVNGFIIAKIRLQVLYKMSLKELESDNMDVLVSIS